MAEITKPVSGGTAQASLATLVPPGSCQVGSGLICGADIAAGDACYIKSDGLVYPATGAAANAAALVDGFAQVPAKFAQNSPVTLFDGIEMYYPTGQNPGTRLFLSGTNPGGFATVASTGGTVPIAKVIDATRIRVYANN